MARHTNNPLQAEVRTVLNRLRRHIRRYVFVEGAALVLALLSLLFWLSLALDAAYFELRSLELPVWFRKAFVIVTLCAFAFTAAVWILLRVFRRLRAKALALVLERRFPELNDRLITAVELAETASDRDPELTRSMLGRAVEELTRELRGVDIDAVFDKRPLRRAVIAALVLVTSVGGFAATNAQAMSRWKRAYIQWDEEYWNRETLLVPKVIAQPGDRVREFDDYRYKHPRGADLDLVIDVPEGRTVPEEVELEYRLAGGRGGGTVPMSKLNDPQFEFRHAVSGLLESMQFWIKGGDYVNRQPYRVTVVDPPELDRVVLRCDYPDYTGLDESGEALKEVHGARVSVPMETAFELDATSNKPLRRVHVHTELFEIDLRGRDARLTLLSQDGEPRHDIRLPTDRTGGSLVASDGKEFRLPFQVTTDAAQQLVELDMLPEGGIPLPPETLLRIRLYDADEIANTDPARLTVGGIADKPPVVETGLQGISSTITRRASIPVTGTVTDDYGIRVARFEFRVDGGGEWRKRPFRRSPQGYPEEFRLKRSEDESVERFEVLPLDLSVGQKLTLTVYARDGDNLNGPHESRGRQYAFNIVSEDELLAKLYSDELNLRRRFEQIIEEVKQTRKDLLVHRDRAEEGRSLEAKSSSELSREDRQKLQDIERAVGAAAARALHQIRKNAGETAAVEESFREILQELINNGVHTSEMVQRLDDLILQPLHGVNTVDYPAVDEAVSLFQLDHEKGRDPVPRIEESVARIDTMLRHMHNVLDEMRDLVEFHEALRDLKSIIDEEKRLAEETEKKRNRELIEGLQDLQ